MRRTTALLIPLFACCSGEPLKSCIQGRQTVAQGVYGQLFAGCDTPDCQVAYAVGDEVRVYDRDPTPPSGPQNQGPYDSGTTLMPIARTVSAAEGFYEVALAPGNYYLCSFTFKCVRIAVGTPVALLEEIFTSGPGGGVWNSCFLQ